MDRSRLGLAAGDAGVVSGVVLAGQVSHGVNPIVAPLSAVETLLPFLGGWLLAAALLGVYEVEGPRRGARLAAGAWLAGANLGLIARGSPALSGGTAWPFPLVITGAVLVALLAVRGVVAAGVSLPRRRAAGD